MGALDQLYTLISSIKGCQAQSSLAASYIGKRPSLAIGLICSARKLTNEALCDTPHPSGKRGGSLCSYTLAQRESDDNCHNVILQLAPRWRVIVCRDYLQWIIQKRTAEPLHRGVWRSQSYVTCRNSLIRLCASLELLSDDTVCATLYALPEQFSGLLN